MQKFPHTRAQLAAIARQYSAKTHDSSNGTESVFVNDHSGSALGLADEDGELNRVSTSFLNRVVALLVNENEDELKTLLKNSYHIDDDGGVSSAFHVVFRSFLSSRAMSSLNKMSWTLCISIGTMLRECLSCF